MSSAAATEPDIVVGVDGSPASGQALRWAVRQGRLVGAGVVAVMAWEYPPVGMLGLTLPGSEVEGAARQILAETVEGEFGSEPPARLTQRAVFGPPAAVLIDAARDAQLLVVGSRGRGGFAGLLLGSVSRACVEHALCPVLVIHERREPD